MGEQFRSSGVKGVEKVKGIKEFRGQEVKEPMQRK
jgi:hypothetical protein